MFPWYNIPPTCGDIFPDASNRDCGTFDPISISVFHLSFDPSMHLFRKQLSLMP